MIEVKRVEKDFWACNSCKRPDSEINVFWIVLTDVDDGGSASTSFRLCTDCMDELYKKIGGVKNE